MYVSYVRNLISMFWSSIDLLNINWLNIIYILMGLEISMDVEHHMMSVLD
jgi:hypothetical protein